MHIPLIYLRNTSYILLQMQMRAAQHKSLHQRFLLYSHHLLQCFLQLLLLESELLYRLHPLQERFLQHFLLILLQFLLVHRFIPALGFLQ